MVNNIFIIKPMKNMLPFKDIGKNANKKKCYNYVKSFFHQKFIKAIIFCFHKLKIDYRLQNYS